MTDQPTSGTLRRILEAALHHRDLGSGSTKILIQYRCLAKYNIRMAWSAAGIAFLLQDGSLIERNGLIEITEKGMALTVAGKNSLNHLAAKGMVEHVLEATADNVYLSTPHNEVNTVLMKGDRVSILDKGPDPEAPTDYALGHPTVFLS